MKCSAIRRGSFLLCITVLIWALMGDTVFADDFVDVSDQIDVSTANARSVLNRRTRQITGTVDVSLSNISESTIASPLHIVVQISGADVSQVQVTDALGGAGTAPYDTYYYEIPFEDGFAPGESYAFTATFIYASNLRFTYDFFPYAEPAAQNIPPAANAGPDAQYTLEPGQSEMEVALDGSGSEDSDGNIVAYQWTGTPEPSDEIQPVVILTEGRTPSPLSLRMMTAMRVCRTR